MDEAKRNLSYLTYVDVLQSQDGKVDRSRPLRYPALATSSHAWPNTSRKPLTLPDVLFQWGGSIPGRVLGFLLLRCQGTVFVLC